MPTNFPVAVDDNTTLPAPAANNPTNSPSHASQHANANAAIKAVENKVGIGATAPAANTLLIGTGPGTSAWSQLTSTQLASILSDETGSGSAVFNNTPVLFNPKIDSIQENTVGNGVTVGGVNMKGGVVTGSGAGLTNVPTTAFSANSIDGSKIKWSAVGANAGIWWEELGRTTLTTAGDALAVSSLPPRNHLKLIYFIKSVNSINITMTFNGDTGTNYAYQYLLVNGTSVGGGSGGSLAGLTSILPIATSNNDNVYGTAEIVNYSSQHKILTAQTQVTGVVASAGDPALSIWGHWVNNTQISSVTLTNPSTGDYGIGSQLIVLGHD